MKINTCKVCGAEFEAKTNAHKICSESCRNKAYAVSKTKWRTKTPEHKKQWSRYTKAFRARNPFRAKVSTFKAKSRQLGLPFDLDEQWFVDNQGTHCPILGIEFNANDRNAQASVDRIIPELGYTKGNCRIISMKANRLKNNATIDELEKIIAYMKNSS